MRLRADGGFTLIELMLVMTISIVILGATLTTLERFVATESTTRKVSDAQDQIRTAVDRVMRQLRNLACR